MNSKGLGERIARQVLRAFYDDAHVIVFDGLLMESIHPVNDVDLAQHLGLPAKLVRTCLQTLKRDGFVQERSQRQASNAKKAAVFLWLFNVERFARTFRFRMLMVRKHANALSAQAIAEETFICSSENCFYHTQPLSTIEAIQSCRRLQVTDFICEHCRSPLTKQTQTAVYNHEDLKARINQQLAIIENQVTQLVQVITQERAEQAAQAEASAQSMPSAVPTGQEPVMVHIESQNAALHAKMAAMLSATTPNAPVRMQAAPWEVTKEIKQEVVEELETIDVVVFEEILRRQEDELNRPLEVKPEHVLVEKAEEKQDGVMVMLGGRMVPLSSITEEMAHQMTNDEYEAYEEALRAAGDYDIHDEFDI